MLFCDVFPTQEQEVSKKWTVDVPHRSIPMFECGDAPRARGQARTDRHVPCRREEVQSLTGSEDIFRIFF